MDQERIVDHSEKELELIKHVQTVKKSYEKFNGTDRQNFTTWLRE